MKKVTKSFGIITSVIFALLLIGCGTNPSTRVEKPIGYITDIEGNKVNIYKTDGVSDKVASVTSKKIIDAYNDMIILFMGPLSGKFSKIYIVADNEYSFDKDTGVLNLSASLETKDYADILWKIAEEFIPTTKIFINH